MSRLRLSTTLALPAGIACLALLTLINAQALPIHAAIQSLLLYSGIALVVVRFTAPPAFRFPPSASSVPLWFKKFSPLLVIIVLALALRLIGLTDFVSKYVDELYPASQVTRLRENPTTPILTPMDEPQPFTWVYASWQYASTLVFGANLFALRIVNVIIGTLTVWATYHLAAVWYGRSVGLLAALLLATFPPHLHLSRLGLINTPDALFGVLALWLLARAWLDKSSDWALAGAALGATAYFHEGGRLLYPALVIVWLLTCIGGWATRWRGLLIFATCALLTAAPALITLAAGDQALAPRLADAGVTSEFWWALLNAPLQDGLWTVYFRELLTPALLHYVSYPDSSVIYYGGQTALVLPYLVPFFLVGIIALIARLRQPPARLLLLWLLGTAIGNSFLGFIVNRYTARFLVAFPAIAITLAIGMWSIFNLLLILSQRVKFHAVRMVVQRLRQKERGLDILSIAVLILALVQPVYYFAIHLPAYNQDIYRIFDEGDVIQRTAALPTGTTAYLITRADHFRGAFEVLPRFWDIDIHLTLLEPADISDAWLAALPTPPLAFFVAPDDTDMIRRLQTHFPALSPAIGSPYNVPVEKQYLLFRLVIE